MRRTVLWVAAVVAAGMLGGLLGSSWRDRGVPPGTTVPVQPQAPASRPPEAPSAVAPGDPFLQIEGTTLSAADPGGRRLWDLRAAQLSVDNARRRVVLTRVSGQFYSRGAVAVTFIAPSSIFHVTSRDVEMTGGVVGRTADGRVLRASRVVWKAGARTIQASGTVILRQEGVAIHSDRLTADAALDQVRFSGNVLVRVTE